MLRFLFVCSLTLMSVTSYGLEVYETRDPRHPLILIFAEDKEWIVQRIERGADGWPELSLEKKFASLKGARSAVREARALRTQRTFALPVREAELKSRNGESLWTVKEQWSLDWERKYSQWVREELNEEWWQRHNVPTDCADVAYSARWIFARIHGLPMANRLASGEWFTQNSVRSSWLKLPTDQEWHKDKRFLAALNYMLDFVFTHSLWNDSYPIRIAADSLVPGAHHLRLHDSSGHTQFVWKTSSRREEIPVLTLNSTVPRQNRLVMPSIFFEQSADRKGVAFQRMRWPQWRGDKVSLVDKQQMPDYSEEQFEENFVGAPRTAFWEEVFFRLNPQFDFKIALRKGLEQLEGMFLDRAKIVEDGYAVCQGGKCPQGSALFEDWSTPARDGRISATINTLSMLQWRAGLGSGDLEPILSKVVLRQDGLEFTLAQLRDTWGYQWYSSDPNLDPLVRWGVHPRSVAERATREIKAGLSEREAHLQKPNPCVGGHCGLGTASFLKHSSHSIDTALKKAAGRVQDYCSKMAGFCAHVRTGLSLESAVADGKTLDMWSWIQAIPLFNSDPRLTTSERYTSQQKSRPYIIRRRDGNIRGKLKAFRNRMVLIGDERPMLYRIEGGRVQPWSFPGEETVDLDGESGHIWTSSGTTLRVRHIDTPETVKAFEMDGPWLATSAYAGRLLVSSREALRLLDGLGDEIIEVARFSGNHFIERGKGIVSVEGHPEYTEILDIAAGTMTRTPRMMWIFEVEKSENGHLVVKYFDNNDVRCAVIYSTQFYPLPGNGRCVWVDPQTSSAAFVSNGAGARPRYIHRTYKNWVHQDETDLGPVDSHTSRFIRLTDGRSYCLKSTGRVLLPPSTAEYRDCNDRFLILTAKEGESQLVDAKAGTVVLSAATGTLTFASNNADEHYVFAHSYNADNSFSEVIDANHPERFSLFSQPEVRSELKTGRANGLELYSFSVGIWIGDASSGGRSNALQKFLDVPAATERKF